MASTVRIASKLPMALRIQEPDPNPEKPGLSPQLRSAVINGTNLPGAAGEGITELDGDLWKTWSESEAGKAYADNIRVLGKDEDVSAGQFGFEPALAALVEDKDNAKLAKQGSTIIEAGPVSAADMKPTSTDAGAVTGQAAAPVTQAPASLAASSAASTKVGK